MCLLYKFHQSVRLVSHLINYFSEWMFTMCQESATKSGTKNEISYIFISLSDFVWLYYSGIMHDFNQSELYHAVEAIL